MKSHMRIKFSGGSWHLVPVVKVITSCFPMGFKSIIKITKLHNGRFHVIGRPRH